MSLILHLYINLCWMHVGHVPASAPEWNSLHIHSYYRGMTLNHYNTSWTAPSKVTGVSLSKTEAFRTPALRVTWTNSQSDLAISQYQVQYRRSGTTVWGNETVISGSLPVNSTILTGLDAGTVYTVRVKAVSEIGAGEWSVQQIGRISESENLCTSSTAIWCMHMQYYIYMQMWKVFQFQWCIYNYSVVSTAIEL